MGVGVQQTTVHLYCGILLGNKKEIIIDTHHKQNESAEDYDELKSQSEKMIYSMIQFI